MTAGSPVVVIGAGQAGLATGYCLQELDIEFTILPDDERVGDTWRLWWDSLELFTPAFYNGLPGLDFPADEPEHLPNKDEMAEYLETYAETFDLPVELETRLTRLRHEDGRFALEIVGGEQTADKVVVASGAYPTPPVPSIADELPDLRGGREIPRGRHPRLPVDGPRRRRPSVAAGHLR